ncbi:uncharacterized protein RHIMIDRAFT_63285 [Rhizopus microsporus ATCC 52813]|uniref:Uncharacterized protein n=1 Tax=Rhizopus microsporus ATCC 52813 TaxID=1340429 RepID=A0A2G4T6B7_RHIZD|nr:uncharacterized protein RHIMIDRAFT_63285 [Rhizopus microsporus ATCC 52813]PHZ16541.1 hypothetical protein RHIMIDRAFT_63285 [Rhizopus microsporus ATCC 52813]
MLLVIHLIILLLSLSLPTSLLVDARKPKSVKRDSILPTPFLTFSLIKLICNSN